MHPHRTKMFDFNFNRIFYTNKFLQLVVFISICCSATAQTSPETNFTNIMNKAKQDLLKMIQKETFQLNGFDEIMTVPITYPSDICLMEIDGILYAAGLNREEDASRNVTVLSVFKYVILDPVNPVPEFILIYAQETNSAFNMDCVSMGSVGYVAIVNDVESSHYNNIGDGSPVFQLKRDQIIPIQFFVEPRQNRVQFVLAQNYLFMLQTFRNGAANEKQRCPILRLTESTFSEIDHLPCTNAMQMEPFMIDNQIFIAVANLMDQYNNTEAYSTVFQLDVNTQKFKLAQKLKTYGATDIKHFQLSDGDKSSNYLIVANRFDAQKQADASSNAVVYRHESGKFVPFQILPFTSDVKQFLPVLTENNEFILMVSVDEGYAKTYQFNGWKFVETPVAFTGDAFDKGVSRMRTYKLNEAFVVIVVANTEMYRDAFNLFRPKFSVKLEYDFSKAFIMFDAWYENVKQKLHSDKIVETFDQIEDIQPPANFSVLNLNHTEVNVLHTDSLKNPSIAINTEFLRKILREADEIISKDVRRPKRLNDSMMNETETEDLTAIPPTRLSVNELTVTDFTTESINDHPISNLLRQNVKLVLNNFTVDHLILTNNLTENYESLNEKLKKTQRPKRDAPQDDQLQPVIVNELITDSMNGVPLSYLFENTLRTNEPVQTFEAEMKFNRVQTKNLKLHDGQISGKNVDDIVNIHTNTTIIQRPISFAQPMEVNALTVLNRFGPVLVRDSKMDVLFRRSKRVQVITGSKQFESVTLLEPIVLQGKINISSPIVDKIKPIVTVDQDVFVEGDVLINGNVTVQNLLKSTNIFGRSARFSVDQLHSDGLRTSEQTIDVSLEFLQPIRVNNIRAPTQLNAVGVESLIKRNVEGFQTILGKKTFESDLSIPTSFSDAKTVNGIDIDFLNKTILKRSAPNQEVTGTIQVHRIVAENVNSQIILGETLVNRLLTKNTDQIISGNVSVHGSIFVINNTAIDINHLRSENHVLGVDLEDFLNDSFTFAPHETINITSNKWFQNISIGQLVVEGDFWQIATSEVIERRLNALNRDVVVHDSLTLSNRFKINDLVVTDAINDVPASKFGQEWLLSNGKQTFTAPQQFSSLAFEENVQLNGWINGYNFTNLFYNTILRNSQYPILLKNVAFDDVAFKKTLQINGKLSGIQIPDDLILSRSNALQNFFEPLEIDASVQINGTLSIGDTINDANYAQICDLVEPRAGIDYNLDIKGNAVFSIDPIAAYLNSESFQHIQSTTWFASDHAVNFAGNVVFESVVLNKPITTTGHVNRNDLQLISGRYLSLSKSQRVSTSIHFRNGAQFNGSLVVDQVTLKGNLKEDQSNIALNLTQFNENILKNVPGVYIVHGLWEMREAKFLGSLSTTSINNLNFNQDVVLWNSNSNIIRAAKTFRSLAIEQLMCRYGCQIQDINVDEWITKAVLTGLNATIQGYVYAKDPVISHIHVLGTVNNYTFESLLLKRESQTINGNIYFGNVLNSSNAVAVTSLTFNKIYTNFINGKNFTDFYLSLVKRNRNNDIGGDISTNMQFTESLIFDNLYSIGQINGVNMSTIAHIQQNGEQFLSAIPTLNVMASNLGKQKKFKHFHRMVLRQVTEAANFRQMRRMHRLVNGQIIDFVALNSSNLVEFYSWNDTSKKLNAIHNDKIELTLPENMNIIDLTVFHIGTVDLLVVQMQNVTNGQYMFRFYDDTGDSEDDEDYDDSENNTPAIQLIHEVHTNNTMTFESLAIEQRHCFILYPVSMATGFNIFCIDNVSTEFQVYPSNTIVDNNIENIKRIHGREFDENTMILWLQNDVVLSQQYDFAHNRTLSSQLNTPNIVDMTIRRYKNATYVALCINSVDEKNTKKGIVLVYRLEEAKFYLAHTFEIQKAVIVQCEFSQLSSNELILMLLKDMNSTIKFSIYQYKGVVGFEKMKHHNIRFQSSESNSIESTTTKSRFSLYETKHGNLRFLAVYIDNKMNFIECIYQ